MILFSLRCDTGHRFEGWFRNNTAYDAQIAAGEVMCPECGSVQVKKAIMAPNIARRPAREDEQARRPAREDEQAIRPAGDPAGNATAGMPVPVMSAAHGDMARIAARLEVLSRAVRRYVEATCENVGRAFPEEARRIHYGEAETRGIYGEATPAEAEAMRDEGIEVFGLPRMPREN